MKVVLGIKCVFIYSVTGPMSGPLVKNYFFIPKCKSVLSVEGHAFISLPILTINVSIELKWIFIQMWTSLINVINLKFLFLIKVFFFYFIYFNCINLSFILALVFILLALKVPIFMKYNKLCYLGLMNFWRFNFKLLLSQVFLTALVYRLCCLTEF